MTQAEDYRRYLALRGDKVWEAACVTWVRGLDAAGVARAFGGDRTARRLLFEVGDWVIVVEPGGFQGTRPEVLRELTRDDGVAVAVYWNANADNELAHAVDGQVVTSLDMVMYPDEEPTGTDPHALDPYLAGLPFEAEDADCFAAGLAVAERVSGVRLDDAWVRTPHKWMISAERPWPDDVVDEEYRAHPVLAEPEIAAIASAPTPDKLRAIAIQAARIAARRARIETEPAVAEALAALQAGERADHGARLRNLAQPRRAEFEQALERAKAEGTPLTPADHERRDQAKAIKAVAAAFHRDPAKAAHLALFNTPSPDLDEDDHVRLHVLRRCERRARGLG